MLFILTGNLIALLWTIRVCDCQTSCTISGEVEGLETTIRCQFPEDIVYHKHSVNILKYDLMGPVTIPDLPFRFYWPKGLDFPVYHTDRGFEFDGRIGTSVTVSIPNTTREHAGLYLCDYSAATLQERVGCHLQVKGSKISCETFEAYLGERVTVTCIFNSNLTQTRNNFFVYRTVERKPGYVRWTFIESVLNCAFLDTTELKTICSSSTGFTFNEDRDLNSNRVTVHVDGADSATYFCDTVPSTTGVSVVGCPLNVKVRSRELPLMISASSSNVAPSPSSPLEYYPAAIPENGAIKLGQCKLFLLFCYFSLLYW